jgi:NitT/TauT family transport system permease protein
MRRHWEILIWPLLGVAGFLAIWYGGVVWTGTRILPSPIDVSRGMAELLRKGLLWSYIRDSLLRVGVGYSLAVLCGIPLGILLGWYPGIAAWLDGVIQILRPISPLAWMPLAIVWFGVGNISAVFLISLASFFPVVVSTASAVRGIEPIFLRAGQNFGLPRAGVFLRVVFPAVLPKVLIGLRIALGIAWLVVVAAEMVAVNSGLGYLIIDSRNAGKRYDLVAAGMLLIGFIGWFLDAAVRRLESLKSVRWGFSNDV